MFRYPIILSFALWAAGTASAASWADSMFDELNHDFGSVPRGTVLLHSFNLTNRTKDPVHVSNVRVSCGCVTAWAAKSDVEPGKSTTIQAQMDSGRFHGVKSVTVYVTFDRPQYEEARLSVQANSRDDVSLTPEALAFGQIHRGGNPVATVTINFSGNPACQVLEARCDSNYVQAKFKEVRREGAEVAYEVAAEIRPDAPIGKWYSNVWLKTDSPATPRVRVPLTVEIESGLSVSPSVAELGQVKMGEATERKVILRGVKPFHVTEVQGTDANLTVEDSTKESKPVHVLTVKLKGANPGEMNRTVKILTDLKEDNVIEFRAVAQVNQ